MTVQEAVQQIRREAGRVGEAQVALERLQKAIPLPLPEEIEQMAEGARPVSPEAHLLAVLQAAIVDLENVKDDLRSAVGKNTLAGLEEAWKKGRRPAAIELRRMRAALEARRDETG